MTDIGKPVLYPISAAEQEVTLQKHAEDDRMVQVLKNAYAVQNSIDRDIREWHKPTSGSIREVIAWLHDHRSFKPAPTPYDYRRYARGTAAGLVFAVVSPTMPAALATRRSNDDKWSTADARDYWRCVAICSAAWIEESPE